jgi:signal transduction histidine kinase
MRLVRIYTPLGYLAVYLGAIVLGRLTIVEGSGLALFWPAAGIAALWMLRGTTKPQVVLDATLLFVSTTVLFLLLDVALGRAVLFGTANLVQGFAVRAVLARLKGRPQTGPVTHTLTTPRGLLRLAVASMAASIFSAPFATAGLWLASGEWSLVNGWVVRNFCGTFVVAATAMTIMGSLQDRRHRTRRNLLTAEPRRHSILELFLAIALTLTSGLLVFTTPQQLPIAYVMIATSAWIGFRFAPLVGAGYSLTFGTLALLCTLAGSGPFGLVEDPMTRAISAQLFVAVTTMIVLLLAFGVIERVRLTMRLRESEARATSRAELLDAVMNVMTDGLVVLESSGTVMVRNQAADTLAGNPSAPGEAGSPEEHGLFHTDGSVLETDDIPHLRALRGEVVPPEDLLRIDPDTGHQVILSVAAVPLPRSQATGGPLAVLVMHDVTQERAHRRELQAFAGTVAHDLKAPLTGIRSWAELLADQLDVLGVDVTETRSSLRRIETSAQRMDQLISDLLSYSQAQTATLTPVPLSLTGMVEAVARDLRDVNAGTPPVIEFSALGRVLADRTLVGQLLTNVIGNAVKYVAPGTTPHVIIKSEVVAGMLEIRVADNGIGIPRAERGQIFDSFYRAEGSGSYPGTGLGLAICARAIERHGGRISARAGADGRGTTLVFTLPADLDGQDEDQDAGDTTKAEPPPRLVGSATAVS